MHWRALEVPQAATGVESYVGLYRDSILVVATTMDRRVTHPSKEQIRAYMVAREHAHRPPPAPEEIRRQLGWELATPPSAFALIDFYLLPAFAGQYLTRILLNCCLVPLYASALNQVAHTTKRP